MTGKYYLLRHSVVFNFENFDNINVICFVGGSSSWNQILCEYIVRWVIYTEKHVVDTIYTPRKFLQINVSKFADWEAKGTVLL